MVKKDNALEQIINITFRVSDDNVRRSALTLAADWEGDYDSLIETTKKLLEK